MSEATSEIQEELVKASGFEATKNYERQDYLGALLRAVNDIDEATFDDLSVDAQDWFNAAVKALNKKKDLPDFPDLEGGEAATGNGKDDGDSELAATEDGEAEGADPEVEADPEPAPAKKGKNKKPVAVEEEEAEDPPAKAAKAKKPAAQPKRTPPVRTAEVDDYGVALNSKNHTAITYFEKGCRMIDVTEEIGGTYYNLLQKLTKAGHTVEKQANGIIKVRHKDGLTQAKKGKAKK